MRDLRGKVAVVTGAASGIGRAMAERFAREGMKVVLADIEEKPLQEARDAITRAGAEALAVRTDVAKGEEVEQLARRSFETFGAVHVLCNNAGIGCGGPIWKVTRGDWEWILGVNLWGVVHGIRAFVPAMVDQGEGHVVNTASTAGLVTSPGMAPYCATKHAVVALTECLQYDLLLATGGKVRASVLCPAWVRTRIAESERNRPAAMPGRADPRTPQELAAGDWARAAIAAGMPPNVVADAVLRAIVDGQFWILTHPEMKAAVERRAHDIVEGRSPEILLPSAPTTTVNGRA